MKALRNVFAVVVFSSLATDVLLSNPDSVRVQNSSSDDDRKEVKKSAPLRAIDDSSRTAEKFPRFSSETRVRAFPAIIYSSRIFTRDMLPSRLSSAVDHVRYNRRRNFFMQRNDFKTYRPYLVIFNTSVNAEANDSANNRPVVTNTWLPEYSDSGSDGKQPSGTQDENNDGFSSIASADMGGRRNYVPTRGQASNGDKSNETSPQSEQNSKFSSRENAGNNRGPFIVNGYGFSNESPRSSMSSGDNSRNKNGGPSSFVNPQDSKNASVTDANTFTEGEPVLTKSLPFPGNSPVNRRISSDSNMYSGIINNFAFRLVESLNLRTNFVLSPLSIFMALSMCYLGSDGATRSQLEEALGLNNNSIHGSYFHEGMKELVSAIAPNRSEFELLSANGMFVGKDFTVNPQFVEDIQRFYAAELKNVDFRNPESSLSVINEWVSKNTRNMITSLLSSPPRPTTRLLLLNAVYFKGIWKTQFPLDATFDGTFFALDGTPRTVPTMTLYGETFPLFRSQEHGHSFIKLPYQGDRISMIIGLPSDRRRTPMPSMTDAILCHVRDAMTDTRLDTVSIPKFRLEFTRSLRQPLSRMGISDLFRPNAVNLRRMRLENDVYVSAVVHKAVMDVNEEGTTASAITSVRLVPLSYREPADFVANHPFAFYVVHEDTGLVLFYGKIYELGRTTDAPTGDGREESGPGDRRNPGSRVPGGVVHERTK